MPPARAAKNRPRAAYLTQPRFRGPLYRPRPEYFCAVPTGATIAPGGAAGTGGVYSRTGPSSGSTSHVGAGPATGTAAAGLGSGGGVRTGGGVAAFLRICIAWPQCLQRTVLPTHSPGTVNEWWHPGQVERTTSIFGRSKTGGGEGGCDPVGLPPFYLRR